MTEFNETPYRDQWRTKHQVAFEAYDGEATAVISDLQLGSALGSADNFINRGDVIVQFDGAPNTIKIEFRRFTSDSSWDLPDDQQEACTLEARRVT